MIARIFISGVLCFALGQTLMAQQQNIDTLNYTEFKHEVVRLGYNKDLIGVVDYLEKGRSLHPDYTHEILRELVANYILLGDIKTALHTYQEALDQGYMLGMDTAWALFDTLSHLEEFRPLLDEDAARRTEKQKKSEMQVVFNLPEGFKKDTLYPLFIVLHGWGQNAKQANQQWISPRLKKHFIVAYVQSSQVADMDGYCWTDKSRAKQDLLQAYTQILKEYPVDTNQIIIGGFSQGGEMAMYTLFEQLLPVKGFLTVSPGIPEGLSDGAIIRAKQKRQKGIIFVGVYDPLFPELANLKSRFLKLQFLYKFSPRKTLGHEMPYYGLEDYLDRNVKFLGIKL